MRTFRKKLGTNNSTEKETPELKITPVPPDAFKLVEKRVDENHSRGAEALDALHGGFSLVWSQSSAGNTAQVE